MQAPLPPQAKLLDISSNAAKHFLAQAGRDFLQWMDEHRVAKKVHERAYRHLDNQPRLSPRSYFGNHYFGWERAAEARDYCYYVYDSLTAPEGRMVLDIQAECAPGESVTFAMPSPDGKQMLWCLHDGQDNRTLRIREVETGEDRKLENGTLEELNGLAYISPTWDEDSQGFVYQYPLEGEGNNMGLRHHVLGTEAKTDKAYGPAVAPEAEACSYAVIRPLIGRYEYIRTYYGSGVGTGEIYIREKGSNAPYTELFPRGHCYQPIGDIDGLPCFYTTHGATSAKVIQVDPNSPEPEHWKDLVPEPNKPNLVLRSAGVPQEGMMWLRYSSNRGETHVLFDVEKGEEKEIPIPNGMVAQFGHAPPENNAQIGLMMHSTAQVEKLHVYDMAENRMDPVQPDRNHDTGDESITEYLWATSKDGTHIPITIVRPQGVELDGTAALWVTGYGGFDFSLNTSFAANQALWIKEGGIVAMAHVRGGGKLGPEWAEQGRAEHLGNRFHDFNACVAHLHRQGYGSDKTTLASGTSAGGYLVLMASMLEPELYSAVHANVPITDPVQSATEHRGNWWKKEFGDPSKPEELERLLQYSPIHQLAQLAERIKNSEVLRLPNMMVSVGAKDKRVSPSQGIRFAAEWNQHFPDQKALLYVDPERGHGFNGRDNVTQHVARSFTFAEAAIGPIHQQMHLQTADRLSTALAR